jgi:hypothetical protein
MKIESRFLFPIGILSLAVLLSACSATQASEPKNAKALVAIAQVFNDDYGGNNDGPVYDRWDKRSQALISRADYIHRHLACATAPQSPAHVESARPGLDGAWLVRYEIDGIQFTDYWFYVHGQWVFDLSLSNPQAVRLYRLSYAAYVHQLDCSKN